MEDSYFSLTCGIDGCDSVYTKCSSFVTHVYRQHRSVIVNNSSAENTADIEPSESADF